MLRRSFEDKSKGDVRQKGNAKFKVEKPGIGWLIYSPKLVDKYILLTKADR
jgi:hypothetical protein